MTNTNIDLGSLETIYTFSMLYQGWECDEWGYIRKDKDGKKYLVLTDHGGEYLADVKELYSFMEIYKTALNDTERALELLKED